MIKFRRLFFSLLCVASAVRASAQDTARMLKDFNKVMSFSVAPYIHYRSLTSIQVTPVLQPEDTLTLRGEFYKNQDNMYYGNEKEEMFMQDSFYIQVSHERKTVWISKMNKETKEKMNYLPLDNKQLQELFRKKFMISESEVNEQVRQLNFESKQYFDTMALVVVNIGLQYSGKNFIPQLLEMNVRMKQPVTQGQLEELNSNAPKQNIEQVGATSYFVHSQKVTVQFADIDNTKEKALQMPTWKERLAYDEQSKEFTGKGGWSTYEITKTF
jgi:hypothetical protein